jgi:5'-3' exonuclease
MWPGYKTGEGIDPRLWAQFHPLEDALAAFGFTVWPMVELEADDALASAATLAAADANVQKVCIWTPDKDLAQCVVGDRVVQIDRRAGKTRDAAATLAKYGVLPASIPDYLAVIGDSADGYPGIPRWGSKSAAAVLSRYEHLEQIPENVADWKAGIFNSGRLSHSLRANWNDALLFRDLATLRTNAPLFSSVDTLRWNGPSPGASGLAAALGAERLLERAERLAGEFVT